MELSLKIMAVSIMVFIGSYFIIKFSPERPPNKFIIVLLLFGFFGGILSFFVSAISAIVLL